MTWDAKNLVMDTLLGKGTSYATGFLDGVSTALAVLKKTNGQPDTLDALVAGSVDEDATSKKSIQQRLSSQPSAVERKGGKYYHRLAPSDMPSVGARYATIWRKHLLETGRNPDNIVLMQWVLSFVDRGDYLTSHELVRAYRTMRAVGASQPPDEVIEVADSMDFVRLQAGFYSALKFMEREGWAIREPVMEHARSYETETQNTGGRYCFLFRVTDLPIFPRKPHA
jgi:hypothetical protein